MNREAYEVGLTFIRKAGAEHKIEFIQADALSVLDDLIGQKVTSGLYTGFGR